MQQEELNRFDRTLAILILLQSRKLVKAQDIADRFGVSLRTIYRDIRSLEAAGVPVIGEAGAGYTIMEGYRLPPVMFTKEEAASFIAAEKLMKKFTDSSLDAYFMSAITKLKAVLKGQQKDWLTALDKQVWATPKSAGFSTQVPNALELLFRSIAEQKQLILDYRSFASEQTKQRVVEPVGVFHESDHWYMLAFCHLRKDYRQFRTDRITAIRVTDQPFERTHPGMEAYREKRAHLPKTRVVIAVDKDVVRYISEGRQYYGFVSEELKDEEVEMTFETSESMEALARWYMMFGDCARVVEPEAFRLRVRELAEQLKANLDV